MRHPAGALDVTLNDTISCRLGLVEGSAVPSVSSVVVAQQQDGSVADDDLKVVRLLLGPWCPIDELVGYLVALDGADPARSGALGQVALASATLDLVDALGLAVDEAPDEGLGGAWRASSHAAVLALAHLPSAVSELGGNELRSAVVPLARRLAGRTRGLAAVRLLRRAEEWPVPRADQPIGGDETMAELLRVVANAADAAFAAREPVASRAMRAEDRRPVDLDLDLDELRRVGLVLPHTQVTSERVEPDEDQAWLLRIAVAPATARAFLQFLDVWSRCATVPDEPRPDDADDRLLLAYARLLAQTQLPYDAEQMLTEARNLEPAPPHLADVVCVVHQAGRSASFGLREVISEHSVELQAVIPHRTRPGSATIEIRLRSERTPYVRKDGRTITRRVLRLRQAWNDGSFGDAERRAYRQFLAELRGLGRDDLVLSLEREYQRFRGNEPSRSELTVLHEALRRSGEELARQLREAAGREDLGDVRRLADELWQTRAFLSQPSG